MFCPNCGCQATEGANFCAAFGKGLPSDSRPLPDDPIAGPTPVVTRKKRLTVLQGVLVGAVAVIGLGIWSILHKADHLMRAKEFARQAQALDKKAKDSDTFWDAALAELREVKQDDPAFKEAESLTTDYEVAMLAAELDHSSARLEKAKQATIRLHEFAKAPDSFGKEPIAWSGKILQISNNGDDKIIQVAYSEDGKFTDDIFFASVSDDFGVDKGDFVTVYGYFMQMTDYTSRTNNHLRAPVVRGLDVQKVR